MAGFATETIVVSTRIMKNPMTRAHRAGQALRAGVDAEAGDGADAGAAASVRVGPVGGRSVMRSRSLDRQ
ncbi:hypothetical protein Microterr_01130 [Microbacterium terricola]|uniref:Uncharacterized protein n=1 Tax=Microbacterium terricola TaxID=344163 RepID=A0ABM8DUZ8_9MICO|nr:hypothetical protein Microterr_01130 [Microbacterium terricola]